MSNYGSMTGLRYFLLFLMFSLSPLAWANEEFIWPTQSTELASPFGPRLLASQDYRYDFHRGVDIPGTLGDPIYAITAGEVFRVYEEGNTVYPGGGNVVILRHNDSIGDIFYSLYLHLDSITVAEEDVVSQGTILGTMGRSGGATSIHLHFEIREGTTCSLESQLAGVSCSHYGYDPHVNPMSYIVSPNETPPELEIIQENPLTVRITVPANELDFNRIEVIHDDEEKILDFNTRDGFDASSTDTLDESTVNGVNISPAAFNGESAEYNITPVGVLPVENMGVVKECND